MFVVEELEEQTREAGLYGLSILVFVLCLHGCLHEAGEDKSEEAVRSRRFLPALLSGELRVLRARLGGLRADD